MKTPCSNALHPRESGNRLSGGNNRLHLNIIANVVNFLVNIVAGIIFTSYLISKLGISAYGMIPLAVNLTSVLSIFTLSINSAVGRFVTVSMERSEVDEAVSYLNTSFLACLAAVLLLTIPAGLLIGYSDVLMRLPGGMEYDSKLLLLFMMIAFFVTFIASSFEISTFCTNRFDVRNYISITATAARLGLTLLLFSWFTPSLYHVGIATVAASVLSLCLCVMAWKKLTPELQLKLKSFELKKLKILFESGGWISVNQVGTLLLLSIDLIIINRLFGPEKCGIYGSILQWAIMLRSLSLTIAGVLGPTIIRLYALHDFEELYRYTGKAVKLLGMFMALPIGLVAGFSKPILDIWLGASYSQYSNLLILLVLPLGLNLAYSPLYNLFTATNKVKFPGIVQVLAGVVNIILALFLAVSCGFGIYGVAASNIIVLTLRNTVFTPLYCARLVGKGRWSYLNHSLSIGCTTLGIFTVSYLLSHLTVTDSFLGLFSVASSIAILYLFLYYVPCCLKISIGKKVLAAMESARMQP